MCGGAWRNSIYNAAACTIPGYQGCYTDGTPRALPTFFGTGWTIEGCIAQARTASLPYAGLQFHGECYGGNALAFDRVGDGDCNTRCDANPAEICGGAWRNSIYATGATIPGYQGCFADRLPRALPTFFGTGWTIEICIAVVRTAGLAYAGLQFHGECWGANELAYERVSDGECDTRCDANPAEICGGAYRNSVYATGNPPRIDEDEDGIDDSDEIRIAQSLLPLIWVYPQEHCASPDRPKPIMFRARHPTCTSGMHPQDYMLIQYYVLFDRDCGELPHDGDNEGFAVFGRLIDGQWRIDSISATAHADTLCEQRSTQIGAGFGVFSSQDKHSNFTNIDACDHPPPFCSNGGCGGLPGPNATYNQRGVRLVNVGEPWHHILQTYNQINVYWWGDIWNGVMMGAGHAHFDMSVFDMATAPPPGCVNWVFFD
jgi:hypothetical protein